MIFIVSSIFYKYFCIKNIEEAKNAKREIQERHWL